MERHVRSIPCYCALAIHRPFDTEQGLSEAIANKPIGLLDQAQAKLRHERIIERLGLLEVVRTDGDVVDHTRSTLATGQA
jgi:hypothetical protein